MKTILANRFALLFAMGLTTGIVAHNEPWALLVLIPILVLAHGTRQLLSLGAGFALGFGVLGGWRPIAITQEQPFRAEVVVASVPIAYGDLWVADVDASRTRLRMTWKGMSHSPGDTLSVIGTIKPLNTLTSKHLELSGVSGRLKAESLSQISEGPAVFEQAVRWRNSFQALTIRELPVSQASIVEGMCFNMDQRLEPEFRDALSRTGTIHIISASGLHVAVIAVALHFILMLFPIPRSLRLTLILGIVALFAIAAGGEAPVVRSLVMAAILMPSYLLKRNGDALTAAAIAYSAEVINRPLAVFDIGVQLSYVTVLFLILFMPIWLTQEEAPWWQRGLRLTIRSSFVAWIASAPLVAYHFGIISLASVPANLAIGAFVMPIMVTGVGASVLAPFSPEVARILIQAAGFLASGLEYVVRNLAALELSALEIGSFSAWIVAILYALLLMLYRGPNER